MGMQNKGLLWEITYMFLGGNRKTQKKHATSTQKGLAKTRNRTLDLLIVMQP